MNPHNRTRTSLFSLVLIALMTVLLAANLMAQSIVTGDVVGTVTDPSGAVVPNAAVTLKNLDTGATVSSNTNANGFYRFPLQKPGRYVVTISQPGFQTVNQPVFVSNGQATTANLKLTVGQTSQTVEVTAETPVIQTENGNISTSFGAREIEAIPNPGNDTSYVAQTAPGVVQNTGGGYGNFSSYGLPADSNLFTVNGNDNMDPYLNLNNTGATNLALGANELAEATVTNNGYSGQFGRQAGAQVNYTTKSGTNQFHGNAVYWWDGRIMNANSWFNKHDPANPVDRPFVNANQWAASIGGPVIKDKVFFFVDTEGLRIVLPTNSPVYVPSANFQNFILTSGLAQGGNQASAPFYQNIFNLYNTAPGAQAAHPVSVADFPDGGCEGATTLGYNPAVSGPCLNTFRSTAGNFTHEWILSGRADFNLTDRDKLFARFKTDHGVQASYTDPINPIFNATSTQPQYEGQLNYNRTLTNNIVNQFILSGSWYTAIFSNPNRNAALAAFPTTIDFNTMTSIGGSMYIWPQGRNVTQYQFVDDLSWNKGNHNLKVGANYRRNDITDAGFGVLTSGDATVFDMSSFATGNVDQFAVRVPSRLSQPLAIYSLGIYGQDQWRVSNRLKLDLSLRADHNSNPVCQTDCFNRLNTSFDQLTHDPNVPYNQIIQTGLHQALPKTDKILWQPRIGFAFSPMGNDKTVIRGGIGIFYDLPPSFLAQRFARNSPGVQNFTLAGPIAPGQAGNVFDQTTIFNNLFLTGFATGGTQASIAQQAALQGLRFRGINYSAVTNEFDTPQFQEWSLEFEQGIGNKTAFSARYVGNHGIHIPVINGGANAWCAACAPGFTTLPLASPDPRFRNVTQLNTNGLSNFNGVTLSLQRKYSQIQWQFNYTYGHALDEISNGGINPYVSNNSQTSILTQIDPTNLRHLNYGDADYDIRHNITANYVWDPGFKFNNGFLNQALGGWTISGTVFWHSGTPYTVLNSNAPVWLGNFSSGVLTGNFLGGALPNCERPDRPCLDVSQFENPDPNSATSTISGFGNTRRNAFRGPGFFDTDLSILKNFKLTERARLGVGANAFNLFNHPNFANPIGDIASSNFGTIQQTVSPPTTPLGAFLASDASFRMIQLQARFTF